MAGLAPAMLTAHRDKPFAEFTLERNEGLRVTMGQLSPAPTQQDAAKGYRESYWACAQYEYRDAAPECGQGLQAACAKTSPVPHSQVFVQRE